MNARNPDTVEYLPDAESDPFLIVGLGNPGRKYRANRHNLGFMVVDRVAERYDIPLRKSQSKSLVGNGRINGRSVILAKPQTYMNLSGTAVGSLARYYQIPEANILVIYDELDIPFGHLRLREKGGAGGHNGMRSIIQHLGQEFPRLRIGVGRPPGRMDPAAFVLQDFGKDDQPIVDEILDVATEAIDMYIDSGIDQAMTHHNGPVTGADDAGGESDA